jgi:hypothetical protein
MDHIGIDVHKKESQICILAEGGELMERRIPTQPRRFAEELGARPHARILLESATESEWVARCLEGLGHEVIVADPNFAPMYATRTRKVKTDRRDARALAEARAGPRRLRRWVRRAIAGQHVLLGWHHRSHDDPGASRRHAPGRAGDDARARRGRRGAGGHLHPGAALRAGALVLRVGRRGRGGHDAGTHHRPTGRAGQPSGPHPGALPARLHGGAHRSAPSPWGIWPGSSARDRPRCIPREP